MDTTNADDRLARLELDIDLRTLALWEHLNGLGKEISLPLAAHFIRAAYGQGYSDALTEPTRGQLLLEHGYPLSAERG